MIENLTPAGGARTVVIHRMGEDALTEDWAEVQYHLNEPTGGAVETILRARAFLADGPVIIANCDQLVDFEVEDFLGFADGLDGALVTFRSSKPHHSYVRTERGLITEIAEKCVISNQAVAGVYYFQHGATFRRCAEWVVEEGRRTLGEFYTSAVIAEMLATGCRLGTYTAPTAILGTPEELQLFELAVRVGRSCAA